MTFLSSSQAATSSNDDFVKSVYLIFQNAYTAVFDSDLSMYCRI